MCVEDTVRPERALGQGLLTPSVGIIRVKRGRHLMTEGDDYGGYGRSEIYSAPDQLRGIRGGGPLHRVQQRRRREQQKR